MVQVSLEGVHSDLGRITKFIRSRQDSNLCGQSPMDFESIALTTRPRLQCHLPFWQKLWKLRNSSHGANLLRPRQSTNCDFEIIQSWTYRMILFVISQNYNNMNLTELYFKTMTKTCAVGRIRTCAGRAQWISSPSP